MLSSRLVLSPAACSEFQQPSVVSPGSLVPVSSPIGICSLLFPAARLCIGPLAASIALWKTLESLMDLLPPLQLGVGLVLLCRRGSSSPLGSFLKVLDGAPSHSAAQAVGFSKALVGRIGPFS